MSSDNFWYVKGNRIYMGDASTYQELQNQASELVDATYRISLSKKHPYHEAQSHQEALRWAQENYAEYGVYWIDE